MISLPFFLFQLLKVHVPHLQVKWELQVWLWTVGDDNSNSDSAISFEQEISLESVLQCLQQAKQQYTTRSSGMCTWYIMVLKTLPRALLISYEELFVPHIDMFNICCRWNTRTGCSRNG